MPASTYEHLLLERDGTRHRWESFLNEDLKLSDMDNEEILKTVRLGIENGRLPESTGTDIPTILEKLDLMRDGVLTHAAAILFANRQMLIDYPQCTMRLARFRGTDRREFIDNQRLHGNIFRLFDAAMAFLFKHLNLSGRIEGAVREERLSIPYKALREGVLNSLAHRSYRDAGGKQGFLSPNSKQTALIRCLSSDIKQVKTVKNPTSTRQVPDKFGATCLLCWERTTFSERTFGENGLKRPRELFRRLS